MTIRYADMTVIMENPLGSPRPRVDVVETPVDQQEAAGRPDLEVALYPDRLDRGASPISLSPSQAVRYADDPARAEEAARTAASRQVVEPVSIAALWSESGAVGDTSSPDLHVTVPVDGASRRAPEDRTTREPAEVPPEFAAFDAAAPLRKVDPSPTDPSDGLVDERADAAWVVGQEAAGEGAASTGDEPAADQRLGELDEDQVPGGEAEGPKPWYAAAAGSGRRPWWRRLFSRR